VAYCSFVFSYSENYEFIGNNAGQFSHLPFLGGGSVKGLVRSVHQLFDEVLSYAVEESSNNKSCPTVYTLQPNIKVSL